MIIEFDKTVPEKLLQDSHWKRLAASHRMGFNYKQRRRSQSRAIFHSSLLQAQTHLCCVSLQH